MTIEQQNFIRKNRLDMSMMRMAARLKKPYSQIRKYMIDNNLALMPCQVKALRLKTRQESSEAKETYIEPEWVPDPWNYGLNPITMQPDSFSTSTKGIMYDYEFLK